MKFKITDSDGNVLNLKKRDSAETREKFPRFKEATVKEPTGLKDDGEKLFTKEELDVLKILIENCEGLFDLLGLDKDGKPKEKKGEPKKEADDDPEDEDEDDDHEELSPENSKDEEVLEFKEEEDEEVEDSCNKVHDSKKSYGAIETSSASVDDSVEIDNEIAQAWANRYKGGNK